MSLIKNLKSLFVVDENPQVAKPEAEAPAEPTVPVDYDQEVDTSFAEAEVTNTSATGEVQDKFVTILLNVLSKNNQEGVDYFEYRQSLQSLKKMSMDEATKYQSAFAMAQTMGATPKRLVDTAGFYLQVLQKEEQKFEQALVNQQDKQIKARKAEQVQLNEDVKKAEQQIAALQKRIGEHEERLRGIDQELGTAKQKIERTRLNFIASYQYLQAAIQADLEKMKRYLK